MKKKIHALIFFCIAASPLSQADDMNVIHQVGHWNITRDQTKGVGIETSDRSGGVTMSVQMPPQGGCDATTTFFNIPATQDGSPLKNNLLLTSQIQGKIGNQEFIAVGTVFGDKGSSTAMLAVPGGNYITGFHEFIADLKSHQAMQMTIQKPPGIPPVEFDLNGFKSAFDYAENYCLNNME